MARFLARDLRGRFVSPKRAARVLARGVVDKDLGYQKALRFLLGIGANPPAVIVGVPASAGADVVARAFFNEFGTQHIPARPFLSTTEDKNRRRYARRMERAIVAGIDKGRPAFLKRLESLGRAKVKDVQATIISIKAPPNAPSTIAKKGFDDPLVETLEMHNSISFAVIV